MLTAEAQSKVTKTITANAEVITDALAKAGYATKLHVWTARFDYAAGGEINVSSHLREHWNCRLRLHCSWQTGAIERITIQARPARTVTLKYTAQALPGILERVAAGFQADVDAQAQRSQEHTHAVAWATQAIKDTRGLELPSCLVPEWCQDSDDANQRFQRVHRGMGRTPIGRYFPQIDTAALVTACGGEGLTAAQLRSLVECLNNLPNVK